MKIGTISLIVLALIVAACTGNEVKKIKEKLLPSFNINIPDIFLTIPPLPRILNKEIPVGALKTHINMDSTIKAYTAGTFGANSVHFVHVKNILIKLLNADAANNLSNFKSARMRIYSDTASTDIAVVTFPVSFADSVSISPAKSPDISSYLRGTTLNYNLYWKNRKITRKFLKLVVQVTLSVQ